MGAMNSNASSTGTVLSAVSMSQPTHLLTVDISSSAASDTVALSAIAGTNGIGAQSTANGPSGFALEGTSDAGYALVGSSGAGIDVWASGTGRLLLRPQTTSGAPALGLHTQGEQVVDSLGNAYICYAGDGTTVGSWHAVGNLRPFVTSHRVFASTTAVAGATYGPVDIKIDVHGVATGVPAGATAAYCAVQSYQSGVMTLFADGTPDPGIANWSGPSTSGVLNLLYMLVPMSAAGKFKIHTYLSGSIYVDVWGYVL
jgi:hypothetical protein